MENLYTVIDNNGDVLNAGLTLEEAAHEILACDNVDARYPNYGIMKAGKTFDLWKKNNLGHWIETIISSSENEFLSAKSDILKRVVMEAEAVWWGAEAIRDEWYQEELQALISESVKDADEKSKEQFEGQLSEWEHMRGIL